MREKNKVKTVGVLFIITAIVSFLASTPFILTLHYPVSFTQGIILLVLSGCIGVLMGLGILLILAPESFINLYQEVPAE